MAPREIDVLFQMGQTKFLWLNVAKIGFPQLKYVDYLGFFCLATNFDELLKGLDDDDDMLIEAMNF